MTPRGPIPISAAEWHSSLPHDVRPAGRDAPLFGVRRLTGTAPLVSQPALSDDIVCMHLGGAKRVHRWHENKETVHAVADRSITIMPRSIENRWRTIGPIDYLHIVLRRDLIEAVAVDQHGGDPARIEFRDLVGTRQPLIEASVIEMYRLARQSERPGHLHCDSLLTVFMATLLAHASAAGEKIRAGLIEPQRGGLGGWRMRRVVDYMETHFASDIALEELTALTGLSRAHFYRAFRQSTGTTPARHLDAIRAERARDLLSGDMTMSEIASAVGLNSTAGLTTIFRRHFGIGPRDYRRGLR